MKQSRKIVYWTPRIFSILYVVFISLFTLDVFAESYGFPEILIALFMHLLPSFILLVIVIIAWKKELIGAVCFFALAFLFTFFFKTYQQLASLLTISLPLLVIALGFFFSYKSGTADNSQTIEK